jgi:hypothetical protein
LNARGSRLPSREHNARSSELSLLTELPCPAFKGSVFLHLSLSAGNSTWRTAVKGRCHSDNDSRNCQGYWRLFNFDFKQIGCIANKTGSWKRKVTQACPCLYSEEREFKKLLSFEVTIILKLRTLYSRGVEANRHSAGQHAIESLRNAPSALGELTLTCEVP